MDYSKFLDENFDVKDWVNNVFRAQTEASKDQYATTLVMKLQMFIQEVNNIIEDSCQQTVSNLPRVMRDLEAVRQEASILQGQMRIVKHDIQKVEQETSQSMRTLLKLDAIKSRMQQTSSALQEADNWTTLSADVEDVFQSQDVRVIADKLVGLQQSLLVLTDVPDYADRCQYLEALKNRLEALLSPRVVAAFSAHSLETAQMYVKVFTDIGRLPQLYKYHSKCHKTSLLNSWRDLQGEGDTLLEWLTTFYDQLLSTWHTQVKWCSQVFPHPVPIVCDLMTEVLNDLDPSLLSCIARHIEGSETPLVPLIELKQVSGRFAASLENALEGSEVEAYPLAAAVYAPYRPYVQQMAALAEGQLAAALNNIALDHEDILDCVRLLAESVPKLFSAARLANQQCTQLTNGCGYVGLVQSLQNYFLDYVREFRRVLTNVREKSRLDVSHMDANDWAFFQNFLHIVQTCGDLILQTEEFDHELVGSIISSVEKYCQPTAPEPLSPSRVSHKTNPFHEFDSLLLSDADDRQALEALITTLEQGSAPAVLTQIVAEMSSLSAMTHKFAFDIVFSPLSEQLQQVATMEIWTSESAGSALTANLPTFSVSPQEYITMIGQYLMTLPQQLDPFSLEENPSLMAALKHSRLPYMPETVVLSEHLVDLWLESVARGTVHAYTQQILLIHQLSAHATRQLITDIDYLSNVLDDLGLQSSETLKDVVTLLKATTPEEYAEVAETKPQRLVAAIANMRDIHIA